MFKKIVLRPSWIKNVDVKDIFSVSSCVSDDFADYIDYWQHNGYWLFNDPADMDAIITGERVDRSALSLFYYEVYENQYDEYDNEWSEFQCESSFKTSVVKPARSTLQGFDVVNFYAGSSPECSPLSCNSFGDDIPVNRHCLFSTFEESKQALETGKFNGGEPGPFRIFAVYSVDA